MTDPRFTDPPLIDLGRRYEDAPPMDGWVVGIALLLLVGFIIFASWNNNSNNASRGSSPPTAASRMTPPSTTGSGLSSPQPITPAPSKSGTQ